MKRQIECGAAVCLALGLAACGGGGGSSGTSAVGGVRAVNGIPDSSGLVLNLNGGSTNSAAFGDASDNYITAVGSYAATLTSNGDTFSIGNLSIADDQLTTVFGTGLIAGTHGGFATSESLVAPASGQLTLELVHAAYSEAQTEAQLDFYLVTPGAGISGATPTAVSYGNASSAATIAAGTYEIVVTDSSGTTIFDSGSKGVALPISGSSNGYALVIAALDASGGAVDGSPVSLLVLQNSGGTEPLYNGQN
jgi:hypothetical protein